LQLCKGEVVADYKFLRVKNMSFTTDKLAAVAESITNILRVGDNELFGFPGYYNIESVLYTNEVVFKEVIQDIIQGYIENYESRVSIQSITVTKLDDLVSYSIEIVVLTESGELGTINLVVVGI